MAINSIYGISNGLSLGERPICAPRTLYMDASGFFYLDIMRGNGSQVFAVTDFQTIYVDNLANDVPLKIVADGTLASFKVPANSQGFFPISCARGAFGFQAFGKPNVEIKVTLFNVMLPTSLLQGGGANNIVPFNFPAQGARYHLDFANSQYFGGTQPNDTTNANDGRFFRQQVTPALPIYVDKKDGSLIRLASGTPFKLSDRGLLVEPLIEYTTRALYSRNLSNAVWVKEGISVATNQADRTGVANTASRLTCDVANGTVKQTTTYPTSTQKMRIDARRVAGSGKAWMSLNNVDFVEIPFDNPRFNNYGRYSTPFFTVTDPTYVIRMETPGDIIDVALISSDNLDYETSIIENIGTVRRRPHDRPSTSVQGGTTTSVSSGLMDFLAVASTWGVYVEWDSLKPDHFLFGQILRPFADGSMRFSTDDTDVKSVRSAAGLTRLTVDRNSPLKNKAIGWTNNGKCYLSVNGSDVVESGAVGAGPYTALDHKDIGSNGAGSVNMAGFVQQLVIFENVPSFAQAKAWTTL